MSKVNIKNTEFILTFGTRMLSFQKDKKDNSNTSSHIIISVAGAGAADRRRCCAHEFKEPKAQAAYTRQCTR